MTAGEHPRTSLWAGRAGARAIAHLATAALERPTHPIADRPGFLAQRLETSLSNPVGDAKCDPEVTWHFGRSCESGRPPVTRTYSPCDDRDRRSVRRGVLQVTRGAGRRERAVAAAARGREAAARGEARARVPNGAVDRCGLVAVHVDVAVGGDAVRAGDGAPVASRRVSVVLAMALTARRSATDVARVDDPRHGDEEPEDRRCRLPADLHPLLSRREEPSRRPRRGHVPPDRRLVRSRRGT